MREREREVGGRLKDLGFTALSPVHVGFLLPVPQNAGTTSACTVHFTSAGRHTCML